MRYVSAIVCLMFAAQAAQAQSFRLPNNWYAEEVSLPAPFNQPGAEKDIIFTAKENGGHQGEAIIFPVVMEGDLPADQLLAQLANAIKGEISKAGPIEGHTSLKEDLALKEEAKGGEARFLEFFQNAGGEERFFQIGLRKSGDKQAHVVWIAYRPEQGLPATRADLSAKANVIMEDFFAQAPRVREPGIRYAKRHHEHLVSLNIPGTWERVDAGANWKNAANTVSMTVHSAAEFDAFLASARSGISAKIRSDLEFPNLTGNGVRLHVIEVEDGTTFTRRLFIEGTQTGRFIKKRPVVELKMTGQVGEISIETHQRQFNEIVRGIGLIPIVR